MEEAFKYRKRGEFFVEMYSKGENVNQKPRGSPENLGPQGTTLRNQVCKHMA